MAVRGGIKVDNLHPSLKARLLADLGEGVAANEALQARIGTRPGVRALNILNVGADVVNGDTITIGADTFEVDIINTDSGVNLHAVTGALTDSADPAIMILTAAPAVALAAGNLLRIENEIVKILRVLSTSSAVIARARCGTTIAAHAANTDVYRSDANPTNIPVGLVATLTPAVFGPAFIDEFNNAATAGGERASSKASTEYANFTALTVLGLDVGQQIVLVANEAGVDATATTEEFANSTDNVWSSATMAGGVDPGVAASEASVRVPTATEELLGEMHFAFPFTVRSVMALVLVTATGLIKLFAGQILIGYAESTDATLPATIVTLRNEGAASTAYAAPFAATDTVHVIAFE